MGFLSKGKEIEKNFAKIFENIAFSNKEQDINGHYDLTIGVKVDIKGLKKRLRSDDAPDESIHWIEIENVNGDKGWLYGEADYFIFELEEFWVVVDKIKLQNLLNEKLIHEYAIIPISYRLYKRKDRKDKLTLVKTIDLIYIAEAMIAK